MKIIGFLFFLTFLFGCTHSGGNQDSNTVSDSSKQAVVIPSPSYGSGGKSIVIYADFQCPACISFDKMIGPIFEEYVKSGKLTITYKQFPLTHIHKNAERDALSALCSAEQGLYMEYKKKLYELEEKKSGAKITDTERIALTEGMNIDTVRFTECLSTNRYLGQIQAELLEGKQAGVSGTPTVILDGRKLDVGLFRDRETLKTFMDRYLGISAPTQ